MASVIPISQGKESPTLHLCRSTGGVHNTALQQWDTPFNQLCEALLKPPPIGEKDGSYFIRGPLKLGCTTRNDANIDRVDLVVLDGDSSVDLKTGAIVSGAPDALKVHIALVEEGIPHILYSTHSNGQGDKGRRYRILIPAPKLATSDLPTVVAWLIQRLHEADLPLADTPENHRLSQPWFFPRVPDEGAEYLCYASDSGDGLDISQIIESCHQDALTTAQELDQVTQASSHRLPDSLFAGFDKLTSFGQ